MKIKSVSGFACYVKSLNATTKFYEKLGFEVRKKDVDHVTVYSNWYWIDFLVSGKQLRAGYQDQDNSGEKGAGLYIYLSVDDVDGFHKGLISKGFKPSSEPKDYPWGNREFMLRDPDGYNLVFFKRK